MRWVWIDKFVAFESGVHGSAVKNVTLAEEQLEHHFPGYPVMPPSLMIEGMAQTAGILVGEARGFEENVILAKIRKANIERYAVPGDQIRYDARVDSIDEAAAATSGTISINGEPAGTVELMFSHVNKSAQAAGLPSHNFVFTDQFMQLFNSIKDNAVGTDAS